LTQRLAEVPSMLALEAVQSRTAFRSRVLIKALSLVLLASYAAGQRGGSQMQQGNHSIEVHLTDQRGQPLNVTVRVQVLTNEGLRMAEAYSNREQGVADFEGFNDGYFQLLITGPEIETVTLAFQIPATEATHREYVRVELKNEALPGSTASSGDPTISAQDLAVPRKARAEFDRGMEAYAKGDDQEAQEALQRALAIYPNYVRAHNNLGVLYLKLGLKPKAFVEFSKAVEFDPKFAPGYLNLARISLSDGNYAEAEPELKKALAANPSFLNAMVLLCSTQFARQEFSDSLVMAKHVHQLTQEPQYADVHLVSGQILVSHGQNREAAREYQMFVNENPDDPRVAKVKSLISRLSAN
jgi:Tfp pilus assembly protein PilF